MSTVRSTFQALGRFVAAIITIAPRLAAATAVLTFALGLAEGVGLLVLIPLLQLVGLDAGQGALGTVMTTLARLHDKGLLSRQREGKRYLYSPLLSRQEFLEATAREVLDRSIDEPTALALLAEKVSEASASELDDLEALIQRRRKELEK